jgi:hypothetical protein
MYKTLALTAAVCLLAFGCEKKTEVAIAKVPLAAPSAAKAPGQVLEHLQYAAVRKDPAHLRVFYPAVSESLAIGTTIWFHNNGGFYGIALTADEIEKLGVQHLLEAGYISDRWTSKALKEAMEGKRDPEAGMEKLDEVKLDMPQPTNIKDKKMRESVEKQILGALAKDPEGAYAAGLYRLLKIVPDEGWPLLTASLGSNPNKDYKDLLLKAGDELICTVTIGQNEDETMFITAVKYEKGPKALAKMFPKANQGDREGREAQK